MKISAYILRLTALGLTAAMLLMLCSCGWLNMFVTEEEPSPTDVPVVEVYAPEERPMTLERLLEELNARRAISSSDVVSLTDYLPDYTSEDFLADEFSDAELERITNYPGRPAEKLTCAEAKEDVEILFRILRTSYGAYELFGGDEVFGQAEQELLARLENSFADGVTPNVLKFMIVDKLGFIEDTHFAIGGEDTGFSEQLFFRDNQKPIFREDENGFYTFFSWDTSGERWYLAEEDEPWLRLTIARDGELVWSFFAVTDNIVEAGFPDSFTLTTHNGVTTEYTPKWGVMPCDYTPGNDTYSKTERDGVPVISLTSYFLEKSNFSEINQYLNDAMTLRDEDVMVVDLRYNTGGYDVLCGMWLYSLTSGTDIDWGIGYASYISELNEYILESNEEATDELFESLDFFDQYPEYWGEEEEEEEIFAGDTYLVEQESDMYDYDGTIFVVFNKHTYSAGELALFQFENMSNVVFVGLNSNGCLLTGGTNANAPVWLPNSAISVSYSMMLVTSDIMEGFDSYGFMPDVVVDNGSAVQDAINCWNYYNSSTTGEETPAQ